MATVAVHPRVRTLGTVGLGVLCVSQFVDVLSVNTAVIALPDIRRDLGIGPSGAQWVISIYALLFGSLLLPAGRLGDRVGHRRLFTIGLAAFAAGSLLCGAAPSGAVLVAARAATGVAAALTVPAALALLVAGTDEARRPRALGWWTAAGAGGGVAGLALGGVLTDAAGGARRSSSLPASRWLPAAGVGAGPGQAADDRGPLDVGGALAAVAGLVLLLAGLSAIGQGGTGIPAWALLAGAAVALLAFVRIEARARRHCSRAAGSPIGGWRRARCASAVNTAATSPLAVLGALYLQDVRGWSPAANGLSFVPFSIMVIVGRWPARRCCAVSARADVRARARAARRDAAGLVRHQRRLGGGRAHRGTRGRRARAGHRRRRRDLAGDIGRGRGRSWRGRGPDQHRGPARYRDEHRVARAARLGGRRHGDRGTARVRGQCGDRGRGGRGDARPAPVRLRSGRTTTTGRDGDAASDPHGPSAAVRARTGTDALRTYD